MSKQAKRPKKKNSWLTAVLLILLLIVVLVGGAYVLFQRYYNLSNFVNDSDIQAQTEGLDAAALEELIEDNGLTTSEEESLRNEAQDAIADVIMPENVDVYNILLVGVDRRDRSWSGNSDSMILLSINTNTKSMHMISFMRDLYADIPGKGVHKLNAACAYGGGPLLVQTIEENYKVNIDNYASVDFPAMIELVDLVGGVELTMSDEEARVANDYIRVMCSELGGDYESHKIPGGGTYQCDGYQAVGYARNRYVGNSDYQRTERQRTVLTKMMEKIKGMSLSEINSFVESALPLVTHNIESSTILSMVSQIPAILKYDLTTSRVPYDGMFTVKGEILMPDMAATIEKLQEEIYGE